MRDGEPMQEQDATGQQLRVLVVEDSPTVARELSRALGARGFAVDTAGSMAQAAELLRTGAPFYFLAILDLGLPDAPDGEVVDLARLHRVRSVVFTGRFDAEIRARLLRRGVIDFVVKSDRAITEVAELAARLRRNAGIKILVVDDSPSFRTYAKEALKLYMFKVLDASSAITGLKLLERNPDVSLVLTDYAMPGMDGVELVRAIRTRREWDDMAVVGCSSQAEAATLAASFIKHGANDFLRKPFQREELFIRVMNIVETQERIRRLAELAEVKNRFLGMAAHDLRNPIGGIKSFSRMLLDGEMGGPLNAEQQEIVELFLRASTQMLALVNDLLDVTVIESGRLDLQMSEQGLADLLAEQIRLASLAAHRKDITVWLEVHEDPVCHIDRRRMGQVFDNLLSNAVKFSSPGSRVEAELRLEHGRAKVLVRDFGPGLGQGDPARLFRPFERGSAQPTGGEGSTGLGLAIARRIVEAHGGRISAENAPDGGAIFTVSLPVVENC